ncbi:hypothetical protein LIER_11079 [Lithospermum erythrorhizon]|uniref:Uncharacterized protein n=1 Tax=Lithospermum erythrorhizon TaxID=34254 RepID=A0AAV3PRU0_LITER
MTVGWGFATPNILIKLFFVSKPGRWWQSRKVASPRSSKPDITLSLIFGEHHWVQSRVTPGEVSFRSPVEIIKFGEEFLALNDSATMVLHEPPPLAEL